MKTSIALFMIMFIILNSGCMQRGNEKATGTPEVTLADSAHLTLGEGAVWDALSERLFYVDILGKQLYVLHPRTGNQEVHEMPSRIGTIVVEDEQRVLVALQDGIYRYNLDSEELNFLVCPEENDSTQRFNDGKCDPAGRFWVGTMSLQGDKKQSHLFCMSSDTTIVQVLDGITTSNGIVWSADSKYMYYVDTPTGKVMEYAFDNETGEISAPRIAVNVPDSLGYPDGMAIDRNDNLWVCMWGGAAVCCFDSKSGELLERVKVPAKNVTSCAFTGPELNELYITTARTGTSDKDLETFPNAGSLFKVTLKYTGITSNRYSVNNRVF